MDTTSKQYDCVINDHYLPSTLDTTSVGEDSSISTSSSTVSLMTTCVLRARGCAEIYINYRKRIIFLVLLHTKATTATTITRSELAW